MNELTIRRPDDWHLHLRDGAMLRGVLPYSSGHFARAIVMPNLVPPVVTTADAVAYRQRIIEALPRGHRFEPLMTLFLTETSDPDDIEVGFKAGIVNAIKLYPAGATTNSHSGVRKVEKIYPALERLEDIGLPLCVHGEVTDPDIDIFDREAVFIERVLLPLRQRFRRLKIVMEHVTTYEGIDFIRSETDGLAGTITAHHLIINRNAILVDGIHPHYYCLPVAKRESHRQALRAAATSGDRRFFLGTDSAPHIDPAKECASGCAGIFSAVNAMPCLAQVFEDEEALDKLEAFVSLNGAAFYKKAPNEQTLNLRKSDRAIDFPAKIDTGEGPVTVFNPLMPIFWAVAGA